MDKRRYWKRTAVLKGVVMSNLKEEENIINLLVLSVVHDLKTLLMAIRSSLNCTKDVFPLLLESYKLAVSNDLISNEFDISFLEKIYASIDNSIKETKLTNYYIDRLRDTLTTNFFHVNKQDRILLYDIINKSISFCELRHKNCRENLY